ncbi:hypothetical protein R8871_02539 [Paraburkholderia graminis C4D1M]|uniref:Uncharacterized protein n=1 Tax=Paraburkholderia graminis (strain ATCC 700544 / DSM 17151 / LMG 18924 / NCIMB 13744 / C4D1M) TaxID=396598 RepID=B1G5M0_PARG4|nr:hypothetical protein [Paraburkholderia graminis]EDT08471.1 hypothetical protein BgramDRAFT_4624 [Paraburkholderia graminis C4D1M]CAB3681556.1 hypothetical protein R8871_02539 [Paraburkholderia graminis C4D1M]
MMHIPPPATCVPTVLPLHSQGRLIVDAIDRLLLDWHEWQLGYEPVRGYPSDAVFGEAFQSSRQWMDIDDLNEEVEMRLRENVGRAIDPLVIALDVRLRIAVSTAVRNLYAGTSAWVNPRWPATQDADYARAKATLAPPLLSHGLLVRGDLAALTSRGQ